jgi:hypothetical protein
MSMMSKQRQPCRWPHRTRPVCLNKRNPCRAGGVVSQGPKPTVASESACAPMSDTD